MDGDNARRWNERYLTRNSWAAAQPFLVEQQSLLPRGRALDVAMGRGRNAGWLLEHGLRVVGVDISAVAITAAKQRWPALLGFVADLATLALPPDSFDVIVNVYYLDRRLWPQFARALRPGGLLVFETWTEARRAVRPESNPDYLLATGELRSAFPTLETLAYREGGVDSTGRPRLTACLAARRPATLGAPHG